MGWALGVGRVGAIVGPVIGGILLAEQFTPRNLFFMISVPALVAALSMLILTRRLRGHETMSSSEVIVAHSCLARRCSAGAAG